MTPGKVHRACGIFLPEPTVPESVCVVSMPSPQNIGCAFAVSTSLNKAWVLASKEMNS